MRQRKQSRTKSKSRSKSRRYTQFKGGAGDINNIINNLTWLLYTHFEYDDILEIFLNQHNKHFSIMPITIATNNKKHIEDKYLSKYNFIKNIYEYDDSKPFYEKLKSVLQNIKTKYVLYNPDTFVLTGDVDISSIEKIINKMNTDNVDQVRLNVAGIDNLKIVDGDTYDLINGPYYMSIGSAVWNTKSFLDLATKFSMKTYKEAEDANVQEYVKQLKNYYVTSSKNVKNAKNVINSVMGPEKIPLLKILLSGHYRRNSPYVVDLLKLYNIPPNIRA